MENAPTPTPIPSRKDQLIAKKRAIEMELRALAQRETSQHRKAETKGKIIIGAAVLKAKALTPEILAALAEKDRAHLKTLGWL
jgi:hypothetical protein